MTITMEEVPADVMELYNKATEVMNGYAKKSPFIRALMDEDEDEIDRLMEAEMVSIAAELEDILDSPVKIKRDYEQCILEMDQGKYSDEECHEQLLKFQNRLKKQKNV